MKMLKASDCNIGETVLCEDCGEFNIEDISIKSDEIWIDNGMYGFWCEAYRCRKLTPQEKIAKLEYADHGDKNPNS